MLERARIAAEMKDLDQPSRASLRKYGVRFGAYHIYLPALLKPAARALASLLWAQKHDNVDLRRAVGRAASGGVSGRTSFPVDKALPRDAYRVLGYRQCGERAVRVDILERLADLIRPALAWRESSPGEKPAGAFDGRGFVVTQAMTSLTGSAGEDFASILRALGYRMEQRPPLPPKPAVVETPAAEATPAEGATVAELVPETAAEMPTEAVAEGAAIATEVVPAETIVAAESADVPPPVEESAASPAMPLPDVAVSPAASDGEPTAIEATPESESPSETPPVEAPQDHVAAEATAETASAAEMAPAEAPAAASETVAAPELIEVWRPGGRSEERRPRHDRHRQRHHARPAESAPAGAAVGEAGETPKHERHRRGRRERNNEFRKPRPEMPAEAAAAAPADAAPVGEPREDKGRPSRERFEGKERDKGRERDGEKRREKSAGGRDKGGRDKAGREFGGRDKGGRDRDKGRDSGPSHRQYATSASPRDRDRPIDPNSPFAKLAALKEQLTANRKDR